MNRTHRGSREHRQRGTHQQRKLTEGSSTQRQGPGANTRKFLLWQYNLDTLQNTTSAPILMPPPPWHPAAARLAEERDSPRSTPSSAGGKTERLGGPAPGEPGADKGRRSSILQDQNATILDKLLEDGMSVIAPEACRTWRKQELGDASKQKFADGDHH